MEEKKLILDEMITEFNEDPKMQVLNEICGMLMTAMPVQGLKFIYVQNGEALDMMKKGMDGLLDDEPMNNEKFLAIMKNLCLATVALDRSQALLEKIYDSMKDEKVPDLKTSLDEMCKLREKMNIKSDRVEADGNEDDDRTK